MNIMLFSRILAKTGVGNHIDTLSDGLRKQGHNVIVVSGTQDIKLRNESVRFIKVDTLSRNPMKVMKTILHIHSIIKENSIEIVHCHHRVAAIYMRLYNIFYKTPYVYTLHSHNIPHDFLHRKLTFVGEKAIGVSSDVSNFLIEKLKVPSDKVATILNGVDNTKLLRMTEEEKICVKKEWGIPEDNKVVVMHSRIDEVKNHLLVVEAINQLSPEERKGVSIVCSGEKKGIYYDRVVETINHYGIADNFIFVGWTDTSKILGIADFLFLPSFKEGFPLSVVEAFFVGVPVARSKTGGFYDMKYCLPISSSDPSDMVDIIRKTLLYGTNEYKSIVDEAHKYAEENLTVTEMVKNTVKVYNEVCVQK